MSKRCPACNAQLPLLQPIEINQQVVCTSCGLELEVVWLYPLELARVSGPIAEESKQKKTAQGLSSRLSTAD